MSILSNDYSAADVSAATGVSPATLQNWLKRGVIVGHREGQISGGGSPGKHRRFPFNTVMEIAVGASFVKLGVALETAFEAARRFAYVGEAHSFWEGEDPTPPDGLRKPGFPWPYARGETFIVISDGKPGIVRSAPGSRSMQVIAGGFPESFCVVNANKVFDRVVTGLGFHPSEAFAAGNPEDAA